MQSCVRCEVFVGFKNLKVYFQLQSVLISLIICQQESSHSPSCLLTSLMIVIWTGLSSSVCLWSAQEESGCHFMNPIMAGCCFMSDSQPPPLIGDNGAMEWEKIQGGGENENENKHNRIKRNVVQESYTLGSYSHHTSLVQIRLAAEINISVLPAKGADIEAVCQSIISPVNRMASEVRNTLGRSVREYLIWAWCESDLQLTQV